MRRGLDQAKLGVMEPWLCRANALPADDVPSLLIVPEEDSSRKQIPLSNAHKLP